MLCTRFPPVPSHAFRLTHPPIRPGRRRLCFLQCAISDRWVTAGLCNISPQHVTYTYVLIYIISIHIFPRVQRCTGMECAGRPGRVSYTSRGSLAPPVRPMRTPPTSVRSFFHPFVRCAVLCETYPGVPRRAVVLHMRLQQLAHVLVLQSLHLYIVMHPRISGTARIP
ncbi:hypothetical protein EDC01DRAFT_89585 [Geopyxis carbonaria]|nr:hypothetical protein EDC01DRAFT_89585 [Geopyxis carbonaria]